MIPPERGPLDEDITSIMQQCDNINLALTLLRSELLLWAQRSYDGRAFTGDYDAHVKQLVNVIDELKETGQCVVRGKVIGPQSRD